MCVLSDTWERTGPVLACNGRLGICSGEKYIEPHEGLRNIADRSAQYSAASTIMPVQSRLANLTAHLQASTVNVGGKEWEVSHVSGVTTYRCASSSGAIVAMLGAGGGIGQPISMLLQLSPLVGELRLYDVVRTLGVGADLGHIDSNVRAPRPPPRRASVRPALAHTAGVAAERAAENVALPATPSHRAARHSHCCTALC